MLVKIEAGILIFPGTDFHVPSTSVPPATFLRLWLTRGVGDNDVAMVSSRFVLADQPGLVAGREFKFVIGGRRPAAAVRVMMAWTVDGIRRN